MRQGTYIAFDASGIHDAVNSNLHTFQQLSEWLQRHPGRLNIVNLDEIHFAVEHSDQVDTTQKQRMERQMAAADNILVIASPVLNTESEILNWQISRAVNHHHLPVIIAYAGLDSMTEDTIRQYWTWLPRKFKKYITRYPWARMAHIPLTMDKLSRATKQYSAERQEYPWDAETVF